MNITKRIISTIISAGLILSLTSCANGKPNSPNNGSTAPTSTPSGTKTGAWVEQELKFSADISAINGFTLLEDNTLVGFGYTGSMDSMQTTMYKFTSSDNGKTWAETPIEWDSATNGILTNIITSENETQLYRTVELDSADRATSLRFFLQRPGKQLEELILNDIDTGGNASISVQFIDNSTLFIVCNMLSSDEAHIFYDIDEGRILGNLKIDSRLSSVPVQWGIAPVYGEKRIYFPNYNQNNTSYEILKAGAGEDLTVILENMDKNVQIFSVASDKSGAYYFANNKGIYGIAKDGTICEEIVNAAGMQLSSLGSFKLCRAADGSFISVALGDENKDTGGLENKLYRYYFDEEKQIEPQGNALHIWSLYENSTVRNAALSLISEGINAEYSVGIPAGDPALGPDSVLTGDVLRAFNSEMLAGGGPDIIILDGLDYEQFIQKGMLSDLSGLINSSALVPFIADAFYKPSETYALPARFSVPILFGDEGTVKGIKSLEDLLTETKACPPRADANGYDEAYYAPLAITDRFGISFLSVKQLCDFALQGSAAKLIENNKIDLPACTQLYEFISGVAAHNDMKNYRPDAKQPRNGAAVSDSIIFWDGAYEYAFTSRAKYGWEFMLSPEFTDMSRMDNATKEKYDVDFIAQPGLSEGAFAPKVMLGINAQTQLKAEAEQFVKTILKEGQAQSDDSGMSVLQSDFSALLKNADEKAGAILSTLKTPVVTNAVIAQKFYENAQKMIDSGLSADDAAKAFEKDIALYLAERQ